MFWIVFASFVVAWAVFASRSTIAERVRRLVKAGAEGAVASVTTPVLALQAANESLGWAVVDERELVAAVAAEQAKSYRWAREAEKALIEGKPERARACVEQRFTHDQILLGLRDELEKQSQVVSRLRVQLAPLNADVAEARRAESLRLVRERRLSARDAMRVAREASARADRSLARREAHMDVVDELSRDPGEELAEQLDREARDEAVGAEVERLKVALRVKRPALTGH